MMDNVQVRTYTFPLTQSRAGIPVGIVGNSFRVSELNPFAEVYAELGQVGSKVRLRPGMSFKNFPTDTMFLTNDEHATSVLKLEAWNDLSGGVSEIIQGNYIEPARGDTDFHDVYVDGLVHTIVAPAENLKGIVIYYANVHTPSELIRLMHKDSAPSGHIDESAANIVSYVTRQGQQARKMPLFIPAGQGLYYSMAPATSTTGYVSVNYEKV